MKNPVRGFFLPVVLLAGSAFAQGPDTTKLEAIQVTATRIPDVLPRIGRHLQVIDSLQLHGQARPEVSEVLRMGSLVDVRERGPFDVQTDLGIRGGTFDQALVLLDGVPLSDPQTGHHAMDLPLPGELLDRVEVLYGGASRTFGAGAFSGAINLITRAPQDNRGSLTAQGGQYGSLRSAINQDLLLGGTGLRIGALYGHSDGYVKNSDFDQAGGQVEAARAFGKLKLRAQAGYTHKRFGAQNFYSSLYPDQMEVTGTGFATVGVQHQGGPWDWNAKAYFRQHDDLFELFREDEDHYRYSNGFFIRNGTDTARFSPTFFYTFHNRHRTQAGGAMANATHRWKGGTTAFGVHARDEHILSNVLGKPLATPVYLSGTREALTRSDERRNLALHADHRYTRGRWTLDGGLLLNLNSSFAPEWAPGLDAVYRWNKGHSTYASLGRAFRFPTWTDLYYNRGGAIGSASLQPEHADQVEVGHRILHGTWNLKVAAWRRQGRDLIDWVQRPGETTVHATNLTEVDLNGLELEAGLRAGKGRGGLLYAYQWADQHQFNFASLYVLDHLTHNAVLWWNQALPAGFSVQANLTWKQRYGTYARFSDGVQVAYPNPLRMDLKADWTHRSITLFASIYNLLDAQQMDRGNIALPGRWIAGGMQLRWNAGKP
ncbi:MAG: TonB-dependent receptor [Bacteroidetes bacterium]|nr:TonB-dependent receptor [Bacteroidota bacterium]